MKPIQKINKINWEEQFKIRVRRNASRKHEHTKLELVLNLIEKNKSNLYWIRIYTEYPIENTKGETKITDVYYENVKTNEIICYEVQNNISDKWLEETTEFYESFERIFFKTDWILIKEKEISEDLDEINKKIKELIV